MGSDFLPGMFFGVILCVIGLAVMSDIDYGAKRSQCEQQNKTECVYVEGHFITEGTE